MNEPGLRVRMLYWLLLRTFVALRYVQQGALSLHLWLNGPIELVHRPIRILGARYMDTLVNRKRSRQ